MARLANVAVTNTISTWRVRTNDILTRLNQFTILDGKTLYANTLIANNSFTAFGNTVLGAAGKKTVINGTSVANGYLTVVNRFDVSGNTNLGAAGKQTIVTGSAKANGVLTVTNKLVVSGNSVLGATGKKTVVNGTSVANGTLSVAQALSVSGNTVLGATGKKTVVNGTLVANGTFTLNSLSVGFLEDPSNSQSASYTTVLGDSGYSIDHPSTDANARTYTIDSNANVAYPVGTCIMFSNMTSQVVTIAITTDTMYLAGAGTTGSRSLAQYGVATARKLTSTTWLIMGTGLT